MERLFYRITSLTSLIRSRSFQGPFSALAHWTTAEEFPSIRSPSSLFANSLTPILKACNSAMFAWHRDKAPAIFWPFGLKPYKEINGWSRNMPVKLPMAFFFFLSREGDSSTVAKLVLSIYFWALFLLCWYLVDEYFDGIQGTQDAAHWVWRQVADEGHSGRDHWVICHHNLYFVCVCHV